MPACSGVRLLLRWLQARQYPHQIEVTSLIPLSETATARIRQTSQHYKLVIPIYWFTI